MTISADFNILNAIKECEKQLPGKVKVKLITTDWDKASQRVCDSRLSSCETLKLESSDCIYARFMVINGREVISGVSAPPRKHHGIRHACENPVDWSNMAYASSDRDAVASHMGLFSGLWSAMESRELPSKKDKDKAFS